MSSSQWPRSDQRLSLYLLLIVIAMVAGLVGGQRFHGIFACPANGYPSGSYLAYCGVTGYGDYDHGAFWFDLEPEALVSAKKAEVLFLGNSRMQLGFASDATKEWFRARTRSYYLLGFAYDEKMLFATEILQKLKPTPKAVVINVDKFFSNELSEPADFVLNDPGARHSYSAKKILQNAHRLLCGRVPGICGNDYAFYKNVGTGGFIRAGGENTPSATTAENKLDEEQLRKQVALAVPFIERLGLPSKCVILTVVPFPKTPIDEVRALASALQLNFIAPDVEGLQTSDGAHLDVDSAERWSSEFFRQADPVLSACLADPAKS